MRTFLILLLMVSPAIAGGRSKVTVCKSSTNITGTTTTTCTTKK
jgi:hypothetical protein